MKRKIFYFIISCIFAVVTSANTPSQVDFIFELRVPQSSILNNEIKKKEKDYTSIILSKIEPVQKNILKNNFEEYTFTDFEDIEVEKNTIDSDRLIEKREGIPPSHTILYRYSTRVLRI